MFQGSFPFDTPLPICYIKLITSDQRFSKKRPALRHSHEDPHMGTDMLWGNILKAKNKAGSLYDFLKSTPLFEGFSSKDLREIEKIVHLRKYKKDEIVFREDEPGTGMYIIKSGAVRITKPGSADGDSQEEIISSLNPHDFFGELSLVEKTSFARTASAYADCDSELVGFFKPDLLELIERNPKLGIKIIMRISEIIGDRLRSTTAALSENRKAIAEMKAAQPKKDDPAQPKQE